VHADGDATTVSGISLNLTDTGPLLAQALARAVADATAKAAQYAKALGEPLGPVVSVTDQADTQPFPVYGAANAAASKARRADHTGNPAAQLDLGVLQAFREGLQGSGGDDVTAPDRDDLACSDRRERNQSAALDPACHALAGLRSDVAGDKHAQSHIRRQP
jgi:hypothetical protein